VPARPPAQVIATAVSNAAARYGVSYKAIGARLGLNPELIGKCKARFDSLVRDGEWEQLFEERGTLRSDMLPDDWKAHARAFWTDEQLLDVQGQPYGFLRSSERAKDQIRDPANRTSKETFRIIWLEARVGDVYEAMKAAGVLKWPDFHMSRTIFSELRLFYVKNPTRETCMCIYHMRWSELCSALTTYRHKLREQKITACVCHVPKNGDEMRKALICPRAESAAAAPAASGRAAPCPSPTTSTAATTSDSATTTAATATTTARVAATTAAAAAEAAATTAANTHPATTTTTTSAGFSKMFSYDNIICVTQQCEVCKDLTLLTSPSGVALCAAERVDPGDGRLGLMVRSLCDPHAMRPAQLQSLCSLRERNRLASPRLPPTPLVLPVACLPTRPPPRFAGPLREVPEGYIPLQGRHREGEEGLCDRHRSLQRVAQGAARVLAQVHQAPQRCQVARRRLCRHADQAAEGHGVRGHRLCPELRARAPR